MATGAGSDLVPVRKATKRQLADLKGDATFDALLQAMLDLVSRDELQRRLQGHPPAREPRERPPEKQRMIADLARRRWRTWTEQGRVTQLGPRLYAWKPSEPSRRSVKYDVVRRRGLAP